MPLYNGVWFGLCKHVKDHLTHLSARERSKCMQLRARAVAAVISVASDSCHIAAVAVGEVFAVAL